MFLRKDLGVDLQLLSIRDKTLLVDSLKVFYQLSDLAAQLKLARSSYFYDRVRMVVMVWTPPRRPLCGRMGVLNTIITLGRADELTQV